MLQAILFTLCTFGGFALFGGCVELALYFYNRNQSKRRQRFYYPDVISKNRYSLEDMLDGVD